MKTRLSGRSSAVRWTRRLPAVITGVIFGVAIGISTGCATPSTEELVTAVAAEAVVFEPETVPPELIETLADRRVVLLGETHYVQEHQEFVVRLIQELHRHGLRVFAQEMGHAGGWAVNDYVTGMRDDFPEPVRMLDGYWIEAVRAFNETLGPGERVRFKYIDMNHNPHIFAFSLQMMAREVPVYELASDVLSERPGTNEYRGAVERLIRQLNDDEAELRERLGSRWYTRLLESAEIELLSDPLRERYRHRDRERIMIDNTRQLIEDAEPYMVAVNVGMYHAQKRRYMGTRQQWLGEYLSENAEFFGGVERLYSLAFYGLSGERLRRFTDSVPEEITPAPERDPRDLSYAIGVVAEAEEAAVFLDLSHEIFARRMPVSFSFAPVRVVPNRQFDAYVAYPSISVLESLQRWAADR